MSNPSNTNMLTPILLLLLLLPLTTGQGFPSPLIPGLITAISPLDPSILLRYKTPEITCPTAFSTQQQTTGYVTIPGTQDLPEQNVFFWFVGAREPTEALTLFFAGGPGQSSMANFFGGVGGCDVVERARGQLEAVTNEWGWDRASNMLFIDQPVRTGFSYDTLYNGTYNFTLTTFTHPPVSPSAADLPRYMIPNGTFSESNPADYTSVPISTTRSAAITVWKTLQIFFSVFPEHLPACDSTTVGLNLFSESYGGKYAAVFADYIEEQNDKIKSGEISRPNAIPIRLKAIGIMNGCVDALEQTGYFPEMAYNNVYGLRMIDTTTYWAYKAYWETVSKPAIEICYAAYSSNLGPNLWLANQTVRSACLAATSTAQALLSWTNDTVNLQDLTHLLPDPFANLHFIEYLNTPAIQQDLGVPLNWTTSNYAVNSAFLASGDWAFGPTTPLLAKLLNKGVRIGMMYGDRDYSCNWLGGEGESLSIARAAGGEYASEFPTAEYAPVFVNKEGYVGGLVRQFGNLSFSRVFQAGHHVAVYQPETAFQIFGRIVRGLDVGTGKGVDLKRFRTQGAEKADEKVEVEAKKDGKCFVYEMTRTCTEEQVVAMSRGEGVVIDMVWYAEEADWKADVVEEIGSLTGIYVHK